VLGTATAFAVLATILGGIAQNRVPGDARWTSIGTYPEFWVALISGLVAAGLVASSSVLARRFGSAVQRRSTTERDRALVMDYLRARINAWNTPEWGFEVPSAVERRLTATTVADRDATTRQTLTEEAALDGRHMLVILGGPGAGKTWLARRYARRAAEAALTSLDGGAELAEVELPVYTTWDHWAGLADASGDGMRAGLVASSFGADVHHGGGETNDVVMALKEVLNRDQTRVLFVIDSLDEATGKDHGTRLGNLTGLAGQQARVVITSRPGAWDRVRSRMPVLDDSRLVVELRDLSYPEDVEAFVGAWFEHEPARARATTDQLRTRSDVARAAVVPLILTFYCLVAADGAPSAPLPARRHELYDRIIAQSLARANKNAGADPDYRYAERVNQLQAWAWHAVGTSNTPVGLGDWGETFVPPSPPTVEDQLALDALAPRVGVTRERTVRRFQHRTILEHLIAEHLAALGADEAADILVPHLWFDPDWEVAAPAALAAHNRAHPGALLDRVLHVMSPLDADYAQEARRELTRVVLMAGGDSEPEEWRTEHQDLIEALRLDILDWASAFATYTAHWPSPSVLVEKTLDRLGATGNGHVAVRLTEALAVSTISDRDRARALAVALEWIAATDESFEAGRVAGALGGLIASAGDRARALSAVLGWISAVDDDFGAGRLVEALPGLIATDGDRELAITVVLERLATTVNGYVAGDLVAALPGLIVSDGDRERVFTAALERIVTAADALMVGNLAEVVPGLIVSDQERERVTTAVLEQVASTAGSHGGVRLIAALPGLLGSGGDRDRVVRVMLDRVAVTDDGSLAGRLTKASAELIVSDEGRERALAEVLDRIRTATANPFEGFLADRLAEALPGLITSDGDRDRVVRVMLDRLATTEFMISELAEAFAGLSPSDADRERALATVLDRLSTVGDEFAIDHDAVADRLVEALPGLITSDEDRGRVLTVVLHRFATTDSDFTVGRLAEALPSLRPSDSDREHVLSALFDRLSTISSVPEAGNLVEALPGLIISADDRGRALRAVLDRIATTKLDQVSGRLAEALPGLTVSAGDRSRALTVVLDRLSSATDSRGTRLLAEAVPELARELPEVLNTLRRHTTLAGRPLPAALVGPVRSVLVCSDWLSLLHEASHA
jgi:hypothetical protein